MDTEYDSPYRYSRNPMATAAVALGIISLLTCLFFYLSVPCGAMAVLFAILSRGREPMPGKGKFGIVCGICGMALSIALTLSSVWMILTNAQMRTYLESYLQYYLGDTDLDLDRELGAMFPPLKGILGIDESDPADAGDRTGDGQLYDEDHAGGGQFPADDAGDTNDQDSPAEDGSPDNDPSGPSRQLPGEGGSFI